MQCGAQATSGEMQTGDGDKCYAAGNIHPAMVGAMSPEAAATSATQCWPWVSCAVCSGDAASVETGSIGGAAPPAEGKQRLTTESVGLPGLWTRDAGKTCVRACVHACVREVQSSKPPPACPCRAGVAASPPAGGGPAEEVVEAKLHLVDLAGSERLTKSGARGAPGARGKGRTGLSWLQRGLASRRRTSASAA